MEKDRNAQIIKTSIVGIVMNVILVVIKMVIGLLANSIAIVLDAVNNLSDALSSIITIVGTKLAGRKPDKEHPYGYGRIEYLTAMLIAVLVLIAGLTSAKESLDTIIHPKEATYNAVTLVIIVIGIIIKLICSRYVKGVGERIHSQSLIASGTDAMLDAFLSVGTLIAAIINMFFHIGLEGILGLVISLIIIKAGMEALLETLDSIIGVRADRKLTLELKAKCCKYDGVNGAYDLTLHNYGPTEIIGSVHIEVDDQMSASDIHRVTRHIIEDIFEEYGITLTVGIYASNTTGEHAVYHEAIQKLVKDYPEVIQMHGFYFDEERKEILFDLVMDFKVDAQPVRTAIKEKVEALYPGYRCSINLDTYFSD